MIIVYTWFWDIQKLWTHPLKSKKWPQYKVQSLSSRYEWYQTSHLTLGKQAIINYKYYYVEEAKVLRFNTQNSIYVTDVCQTEIWSLRFRNVFSSSAINACVTLAGVVKTATSTTMSVNPTHVWMEAPARTWPADTFAPVAWASLVSIYVCVDVLDCRFSSYIHLTVDLLLNLKFV